MPMLVPMDACADARADGCQHNGRVVRSDVCSQLPARLGACLLDGWQIKTCHPSSMHSKNWPQANALKKAREGSLHPTNHQNGGAGVSLALGGLVGAWDPFGTPFL